MLKLMNIAVYEYPDLNRRRSNPKILRLTKGRHANSRKASIRILQETGQSILVVRQFNFSKSTIRQ